MSELSLPVNLQQNQNTLIKNEEQIWLRVYAMPSHKSRSLIRMIMSKLIISRNIFLKTKIRHRNGSGLS